MRKDFIYLASASPRRSALLGQIGVRFRVKPASICETPLPGEPCDAYVTRLAVGKAEAVWRDSAAEQPLAVLGADTTVVLDGRILGKPGDANEALEMLTTLSGRVHRVLTGVALRHAGGLATAIAAADVVFRQTTLAERRAYCATGEPLDKAGGYGIQGRGAVFVESIAGSYSAVVGLPLAETAQLLACVGEPRWLRDVGEAA
jgi:septum formation protein